MNQLTVKILKSTTAALSVGMLLSACSTTDSTHYGEYKQPSPPHKAGYKDKEYQATFHESSGATSQSSYSSTSGASASASASGDTSARSTSQAMDRDEVVIPLHEEQVNVGKRTVDSGQVTIRKIVTTETVNQPIELRKESIVIERMPASGQVAQGSRAGNISGEFDEPAGAQTRSSARASTSSDASGSAFEEKTYTINLREEKPVVEKETVLTGRVVARKNSDTERVNVSRQIRREDVKLDQSGDTANIQIRGDFDQAGRQVDEPAGADRKNKKRDRDADAKVEGELKLNNDQN